MKGSSALFPVLAACSHCDPILGEEGEGGGEGNRPGFSEVLYVVNVSGHKPLKELKTSSSAAFAAGEWVRGKIIKSAKLKAAELSFSTTVSGRGGRDSNLFQAHWHWMPCW